MDLWKKKHENGQWLEVEAAEAMSMRSEFSALNASGIVFLADSMIQNGYGDAQSSGDMVTENHGNTGMHTEHEVYVHFNLIRFRRICFFRKTAFKSDLLFQFYR